MSATRKTTLLMLLLLTVVGCRNGKNTELVEREMRVQEDRIYQLRDYIEQYQSMLESSRRENATLRRELGQDPDSEDSSGGFGLPKIDLNGNSRRSGRPNSFLTPPVIEPGILSDPDASEGETPLLTPGPILENFPAEDAEEPTPRGEASQLLINPRLTGGLDMNGRPGDEGVMVVVEPHDIHGDLVRSEGELSLMIVDPNQDGINGRIARWDFTAAETDAAWRKSLLGQGLHFELPWPSDPPKVDRLRLYVRLVSPGGQKILAETDFDVDLLNVNSLEEVSPLNGTRPLDKFIARAPKSSWSRSDRARQVVPKPLQRDSIEAKPPSQRRGVSPPRNPAPQIKEARNRRPTWMPFR